MSSWILHTLIGCAVLAVLVACINRTFRFGPAIRHALWFIVLLKLIVTPMVEWPINESMVARLFPQLERPGSEKLSPPHISVVTREASPTFVYKSLEGDLPSPVIETEVIVIPRSRPFQSEDRVATVVDSSGPVEPFSFSLMYIAVVIWVAGTTCYGVVNLIRISRLSGIMHQAHSPPEYVLQMVRRYAIEHRVPIPRICIVNELDSPIVWWFGKSFLLIPRHVLDLLSHENLRGVLLHELAHIKRRDHWIGWIELLCGALWWWNPLFWIVRSRVRENAELACDTWVAASLPHEKRDYAETILQICEYQSRESFPMPVLGIRERSRQMLERRLKMILRTESRSRLGRLGFCSVAFLGIVCLPGMSQVPEVPSTKKADSTVATNDFLPGTPLPAANVATQQPLTNEPVAGDGFEPGIALPPASRVSQKPIPRDPDSGGIDAAPLGADVRSSTREQQLQARIRQLEVELAKVLGALKGSQQSPPPDIVHFKDPESITPGNVTYESGQFRDAPDNVAYKPIAANIAMAREGTLAPGLPSHIVETNIVTLTRTRYRLDPRRAGELNRFIVENLNQPEYSMSVDKENTVTVTCSPPLQQAIGLFISMMQGKVERPSDEAYESDATIGESPLFDSVSPPTDAGSSAELPGLGEGR